MQGPAIMHFDVPGGEFAARRLPSVALDLRFDVGRAGIVTSRAGVDVGIVGQRRLAAADHRRWLPATYSIGPIDTDTSCSGTQTEHAAASMGQ